MTKKTRSPAQKRARARQASGDTRPYMVILQEEKVREVNETGMLRTKPTRTVELPPDPADRPLFLEPQFEETDG